MTYKEARKKLTALAREAGLTDSALCDMLQLYRRILAAEQREKIPPEQRFEASLRGRRPAAKPTASTLRTAIIGDIHGNYDGLLAVLKDLEHRKIDRVICLGDQVGGGERDEDVVRAMMQLRIPAIRGNHDEYHGPNLSEPFAKYLAGLPEEIVEGDTIYTHISPREKKYDVTGPSEAWGIFDETPHRLIFVGHVHMSFIFGEKDGERTSAKAYPVEFNEFFPLDPEDRYVISVGPIGYGRDRVGKIRYGIHDAGAHTVEIRTVAGPLLPFDRVVRSRAAI